MASPPLTVTEAEIDEIIECLEATFREFDDGLAREADLMLTDHQPAIDVQRLAGDVGGVGRGEERDRGSHLRRLAEPCQRNARGSARFTCASVSAACVPASLRMKPGTTAFTVTPRGASSIASARTLAISAAFAAAEAGNSGRSGRNACATKLPTATMRGIALGLQMRQRGAGEAQERGGDHLEGVGEPGIGRARRPACDRRSRHC